MPRRSTSRCASLIAITATLAACASDRADTRPVADPADSAVQIVATGCASTEVHGAGLIVADGRVATVAHVVAGAKQLTVRGRHGESDATVVFFDPVLDLAVLKVDPRLGQPVPLADAKKGDVGSVVVYRENKPSTLTATVQRVVDIRTEDIYGQGKHLRPGYELTLDLEPGDSGSVVVVDGKAVAISWATSQNKQGRSWAMKTTLLSDHLSASTPVDDGHCA